MVAAVCDYPDACLRLIADIFKEIAVVFQPQHYSSTEAILAPKAGEVSARIFNPVNPI